MFLNKIPSGKNLPEEFNVIIEVSMNSTPVKYEFDKESCAIFVDRIIQTSMSYPCNYGFIPHTLSGDGDPVDVLLICNHPIIPGAVVPARAIGVLLMEDESGVDEKILAVPTTKIDSYFVNINSYLDLPEILLERIANFFENYKKLEKNKWVKLAGWKGVNEAKDFINSGVANYKS